MRAGDRQGSGGAGALAPAALAGWVGAFLFVQGLAELPSPEWSGGALAAAILAGIAACRRRGAAGAALALLAGAGFGVGWNVFLATQRLADALPVDWEGRDIVLIGTVAELPTPLARGARFVFAVESVATAGASLPRRLLLSWYGGGGGEVPPDAAPTLTRVRPGERWQLTVRLKRPHGNANPHGFDYEGWLFERGIRATGYVRARPAPARLEAFVPTPGHAIERLRERVRDRFAAALGDAPYGGVVAALAVGDQRAIPPAQWAVFARTGTTHLMSISGLHVTLIAALAGWLAGALWRRSARAVQWCPAQRVAVVAGTASAVCYALLAGFGVPAQRTVLMLGVASLALLSGRTPGAARTLGLALAIVLFADPWAVRAPGFWLSFGAVGALFLVAGAAGRPERAAPLRTPGRWRAQLRAWSVTQWAATLGTLPLVLVFFQQFPLVSPLANALAIPLVSFLVTPLSLLAAALPLPVLPALAHAGLVPLMDFLAALAALSPWTQAAPPAWTVFPALLGCLWLLAPRGVPGRAAGGCLLLPLLLAPAPRPPAGSAWVDVLDVGQGLAVVVRTARHTLLYDTGPRYAPEVDAGARVVVPWLRAAGVRAVDHLLLSHRDSDHAGGAASLRAVLPVGRVSAGDAALGTPCLDGQTWSHDGVRFAVLHPATPGDGGNADSCVLRIETAGGASLLLAGDIDARAEAVLLARHGERLRSTVLVAPHHGSAGSSSPAFVAAVAPGHVVYTVGYRNRFGHPHPAVAARYAAAGARDWRSDRDGALAIRLDHEARIAAWREDGRRYWHGR